MLSFYTSILIYTDRFRDDISILEFVSSLSIP